MIIGVRQNINKNTLLIRMIVIVFLILAISPGDIFAQHESQLGLKDEFGKGKVYHGYNLIMISLSNVGTEHMSLYGYERKTTPRLDAWAHSNALIFEDVFSPVSWTLPVITSCFTSLYPYTHRVMDRYHGNLLDKNIKTLAQILKENNYRTAAFTGGLDNMKIFGHMQGFETTDDNHPFTGFDITLPQAKNWLSQNSEKKFFLFIHGYTTHSPFDPPEKFKGIFSNPEGKNITVDHTRSVRGFKDSDNNTYSAYYAGANARFKEMIMAYYPNADVKFKMPPPIEETEPAKVILTQDDIDYLRDLYDEEVLYQDSMIGDFLNSLDRKMLDKTIIIIFSEHGEMFARHGRFGRAGAVRGTLYDEVVHIPLIIKIPERQGRRVKGLVQIIDIMPTILEFLDIPLSQKIQGKSLIPLIEDNKPVNEFVYAGAIYNIHRPLPNPFYPFQSIDESIRNYEWKLIREVIFSQSSDDSTKQPLEETFELYNLQDDAAESNNLVKDYPEITKDLKEKLNRWAERSREFTPARPFTQEIPESLLENARKHGYW
jgi:arylsulfatase A-like enzyme